MSEILKIYDQIAPQVSALYSSQTHIKGIQKFTTNLTKRSKVLDLGCGMGKDVKLFGDLGFEAVGVDGSAGMIAEAKRRYSKQRFFIMDVRDLEFPDDSFDLVWSWSVLTHLGIEDKKRSLSQAHKVLKKSGIFVQTIWKGRGLFVNPQFHPRPHHLLSINSWKKLYKEAGFVNFKTTTINGLGRDSLRLIAQK